MSAIVVNENVIAMGKTQKTADVIKLLSVEKVHTFSL